MWRTLSGLLLLQLAFAQSAAADALPLRWDFASDEEGWHFEVEALESLRDVRVEVVIEREDGRAQTLLRERVDGLEADAPHRFTASVPDGAGRVRFEVRADFEGQPGRVDAEFSWSPEVDLSLQVDVSRWDLESPQLEARARGARVLEVVVRGEGNEVLRRLRKEPGEPASDLSHTFEWAATESPTMIVEVRAESPGGATAWERFVPWQFEVQMRNVRFATGSAEIPEEDMERLREALDDIREAAEGVRPWIDIELWVAGYTDTVGAAAANRRLSEARARSLGQWFIDQGVDLPVRVQGFGQDALAVPTDDGVDEPANRRAIFVLATQPPTGANFPAQQWSLLR